MFSSWQVNVPQLYADIDRTKARQLGVPVTDIFDTMQIYLGSLYANDFNKFGRTYSRARAGRCAVPRARRGHRPAEGALDHGRDGAAVGADEGHADASGRNARCATTASSPPTSTAARRPAIRRARRRTRSSASPPRRCPPGISYEWTELTYQEILAGNSALLVFPLAILLVFLVLAAQYESLTLPLAIMLIVPMGLLAAMTGVWLSHGDNNVFTQIGLIVLVGLSAKNAILIVEFARELEFAGRTPMQAAIEASRLRLRPILMTSMAFVMGVLPLVLATGAGSEMRQRDGRGGVRRNDRRDRLRPVPDAGVLRAAARADRQPAAQAARRGAASSRRRVDGDRPAAGGGGGGCSPRRPRRAARRMSTECTAKEPTMTQELMTSHRCAPRCCRWSPRWCWPAAPARRPSRRPPRPPRRPRSRKTATAAAPTSAPAEAQPRGEWWKAFADPVLDDLVAARRPPTTPSIQQAAARAGAGARAAARRRCRPLPQVGVGAGAHRARRPARPRRRAGPAPRSCSAGADRVVRARPVRQALRGASDAARARRAVARGAAAEHAPAGAGRGRADLLRAARARRRTRAGARDGRGLPRHAAPDRAPLRRPATWPSSTWRACRPRSPSTESRRSRSTASARELEHALAVLVGELPSELQRWRRADWTAALPGDSGRRARARCWRAGPTSRPRSSAMLAAQARVGVAQAAWFPDISLTGQRRLRVDRPRRPVQVVGARLGHRRAAVAAGLRRRPARGRRAERQRATGRRRWRATASRCWSRSATSRTSSPSLRLLAEQAGAQARGGRRRPRARPCCPTRATATATSASSTCSTRAAANCANRRAGAAGARGAVPGDGRPDPRAGRRLGRRRAGADGVGPGLKVAQRARPRQGSGLPSSPRRSPTDGDHSVAARGQA